MSGSGSDLPVSAGRVKARASPSSHASVTRAYPVPPRRTGARAHPRCRRRRDSSATASARRQFVPRSA
jgi:hypothetical protein